MAKKRAKVARSSIERAVKKVLKQNALDSKKNPYMTAYQILGELPKRLRDRLIHHHGLGGKGAGVHKAATKVIAWVAKSVADEVIYFNTINTSFTVQGTQVVPSGKSCGLFRMSNTNSTTTSRATKTVKKKATKKRRKKKST